ncbi:MAG: alpha/beta hydrolase, partial [Pusillimonas sp.]|nr:alpha/beta hydrolase [Pusillimonas sp.]
MSSFNGIAQGRVQCPEALSENGYNLRAAFSDFPDVLKGWQTATQAVIQKLQPEQDVAYGDRPLQNLDFYKAANDRAPLLIFIHGGYWQSGDKSDVGFIAAPYVEAGISV